MIETDNRGLLFGLLSFSAAPTWSVILVFLASLVGMSLGSLKLNTSLGRIGTRLRFPEGLVGIIAALGADAPEYSSAIVALLTKHHDLGLGVVFGSNIFNLAGLLGLSALVAGRVTVRWQILWFIGGVSLLVSAIATALLLHWIPAWFSLTMMAVILIPYVTLTAMPASQRARINLPSFATRFLSAALDDTDEAPPISANAPPDPWKDGVWVGLSLVLIIASSMGTVHSAVRLAAFAGISQAVVGILLLAGLTSIPNLIAAVQFARKGRGAAVVSESLNSNTINILAGICLPAVLIGFAFPSSRIIFTALWLLGMKIIAMALTSRQGLSRSGGVALVILYLIFASIIILWK